MSALASAQVPFPPTIPDFLRPPLSIPLGPTFLHPPPDYSPVSPATSSSSSPPYEFPINNPSPPLDVIGPVSPGTIATPLNVPGKKEAKGGMLSSLRGRGSPKEKDSIDLVFSEGLVFLVPPRHERLGVGLGDFGVEGDGGGKDGRINGFVNVVSLQRRLVKSIQVRLVGTHRLAYPKGGPVKEETFLSRDLFVKGSGPDQREIWLEQGISTFEFSFTLPSSSPVSDRSPVGRCQYHVSGKVTGSGKGADLEVRKEAIVVCNPHRESNVLQFQYRQEALSQHFGPFALDLTANEFLVSSPFLLTLTLASPPPSLTIFGINAFLVQTTTLPPLRPGSQPVDVKGPRRYVVREGPRGRYAAPGWAKKARSGTEEGGTVVLDGTKPVRKEDLEGGFWRWAKVGRIPNDEQIRPSTLPGTQTALRFSTTLVVELVFNEEGPGLNPEVKIATLFEKEVFLASCCCFLPHLALPTYEKDTPASQRFEWRPDGCVGCMCDEKEVLLASFSLSRPPELTRRPFLLLLPPRSWEALERNEIALMRGGDSQEELTSDGMVVRRTGVTWEGGQGQGWVDGGSTGSKPPPLACSHGSH